MSKKKIGVLIVDDSAFMRHALRRMLERDAGIEIAGEASDGREGVDLVKRLRPDVVTMDVEMRGMDGLEALRRIVAWGGGAPPVIMVSSRTTAGARTTLDALELGAIDFIPKPAPGAGVREIASLGEDLVAKIHAACASHRLAAHADRIPAVGAKSERRSRRRAKCIGIGASTGGPVALSRIVPRLPKHFPAPIVVAQHMPPGFTGALAERLAASSGIHVREAVNRDALTAGTVLIAPAGQRARVCREGRQVVMSLDAPESSGITPSVDALFASVGELFEQAAVGVILTGMGRDGVEGLRVLRAHGGYVVGQDEASCVVFGMPRAAAEEGLVHEVCALDELPALLCALVGLEVTLQREEGSRAAPPGT
jgi:two-component system chemotaxis response regulator CheB